MSCSLMTARSVVSNPELDAEYGERCLWARQREHLRPRVNRREIGETVFGQHVAHALARALAPQGNQRALAGALQRLDVLRYRLEDVLARLVALGGKILSGARADFKRIPLPTLPRVRGRRRKGRRRKRRQPCQRRLLQVPAPFRLGEIEPVRRQRLIRRAAGVTVERGPACFVIVGDLCESLTRGILGQRFENDRRSAHQPRGALHLTRLASLGKTSSRGRGQEIIEQRLDFFMKQRQPVLHAGVAAPLADGLVEHVIGAGGAERGDIAGTERPDRLCGELKLGDRHQLEHLLLGIGALRLRVETADRFQRIAKKIKPDRSLHSGRKQIEDAAAHRIIAGLAHRGGAGKAVEVKPCDHTAHRQQAPGCCGKALPGDDLARRHALQYRIDGGEQHRRLVAALDVRQPRQCGHALRHHGRVR